MDVLSRRAHKRTPASLRLPRSNDDDAHKTMIIFRLHSASIMSREMAYKRSALLLLSMRMVTWWWRSGTELREKGNERWWKTLISLGSHEWSIIIREFSLISRSARFVFAGRWGMPDVRWLARPSKHRICHVFLLQHAGCRCRRLMTKESFGHLPALFQRPISVMRKQTAEHLALRKGFEHEFSLSLAARKSTFWIFLLRVVKSQKLNWSRAR